MLLLQAVATYSDWTLAWEFALPVVGASACTIHKMFGGISFHSQIEVNNAINLLWFQGQARDVSANHNSTKQNQPINSSCLHGESGGCRWLQVVAGGCTVGPGDWSAHWHRTQWSGCERRRSGLSYRHQWLDSCRQTAGNPDVWSLAVCL